MMQGNHEFQVSAEELEYLKQLLASRDETLANMLSFQQGSRGRSATIQLTRTEAEHLREYLTEQLAAVGFNESYSPNEQGKKLEKLIERFYLR